MPTHFSPLDSAGPASQGEVEDIRPSPSAKLPCQHIMRVVGSARCRLDSIQPHENSSRLVPEHLCFSYLACQQPVSHSDPCQPPKRCSELNPSLDSTGPGHRAVSIPTVRRRHLSTAGSLTDYASPRIAVSSIGSRSTRVTLAEVPRQVICHLCQPK